MPDKLTWDEIKKQFPDEWVVLVDLDADEVTDEVRGGAVLGHARDKKALVASTKDRAAGQDAAILYTGEIGRGHFLL